MGDLVESLRQRCLEKDGVTARTAKRDEYGILSGSLDTFARFFPEEQPPVLMVRCDDDVRQKLAKSYPAIRVSDRMRWKTKGWKWTDIVFDGSIPADTLLDLIDRSYQRLYDDLKDAQRLQVSMLARGLGPEEIVSELIAFHGLENHRAEIDAMARPAFLLRTKRSKGSVLPPGRTKIGGEPDLPEGQEWPVYRDGRPLAFLAQINLSELPEGADRGGLPARGLLSFFSAWGWQDEGDADPHPPADEPAPAWTRVILHQDLKMLRPRQTPEGVNAFPAAEADPIPIVCLPTDRNEPTVAALGWDEETWDHFSELVDEYNAVRSHQLGFPARNLLLGYADYQQYFVEEVADRGLQLLFQLASDANADMCWGDDGNIYFWADPRDVARGDFTKLHMDYQCG
jgi:uncharacterized protein YwqG/predicted DNA-binding protein (MmcQ/YjbR family)